MLQTNLPESMPTRSEDALTPLYEVEFRNMYFYGTCRTTDIKELLYRVCVKCGSVSVREYNRVTYEYNTVYIGSVKTLRRWVMNGDIQVGLDVYNTYTSVGGAHKLVFNPFIRDLCHQTFYQTVKKLASSPFRWVIATVCGSDDEVFRASAAFMTKCCGLSL